MAGSRPTASPVNVLAETLEASLKQQGLWNNKRMLLLPNPRTQKLELVLHQEDLYTLDDPTSPASRLYTALKSHPELDPHPSQKQTPFPTHFVSKEGVNVHISWGSDEMFDPDIIIA